LTPSPGPEQDGTAIDGVRDTNGTRGGVMLNPGDEAPDFTGRDHNGNTVKLSDFKGKTVVLWFYPKADTPG
jgi:peroxiredoxin Q/BCP